jgi:signal transduction histidine kinase
MATLIHPHLALTRETSEPSPLAMRPPSRALARLVVVVASAVVGGVAADALLGDPGAQSAVVNAATGSAGAVVVTLTAYLFVRRMHRTLALSDVALGSMLTLLPAVSAAAVIMPALLPGTDRPDAITAPMATGVVASLGLAAAAVLGSRTLRAARRADVVYVALVLAGALMIAGAALLADDAPRTVLTTFHLIAAAGTGAASATFFRGSASGHDPVLPWLGLAAGIIAAAHLTDALLPWSTSDTLSGGTLVGIAAWLALLVGGGRDFEWAHRRDAEDAVLDERRRLARELHDGLAQELAYISTESRRLVGHPGAQYLAEAADRALEESRAAILALTQPADEPLELVISVAAQSVGARAGIDVTVAVRPDLDAPDDVRRALLRILREAMSNAARHGRARTVHVSLDGPSPLVMAIADDGTGFDPLAVRRPDSLGIQCMHERACNLGGRLSVQSTVGQGTTVAVVLP